MQDKIKVLMLCSDQAGVGHFRNIWPAQYMEQKYSDQFHVEIDLEYKDDIEYYKKFDIIHFHRQFGPYDKIAELTKNLRAAGVITIMDLDDYWIPAKSHPMYLAAINDKLPEKITSAFKCVDWVSTTTDIFARYIEKYNKNVKVIPNGIDINQPMWQNVDTRVNDKVRIAWIGGSCLKNDTEILTDQGFKFVKDLNQSEKVACLNPSTNELEYHKPNGYIKVPFKGMLNCGTNNIIDYAVTPNHNMYVSIPNSLTQKELKLQLIQSEKVHGKNMHFKKDAIWTGIENNTFVLPKIYHKEENRVIIAQGVEDNKIANIDLSVEKYFDDLNLNMDLWLKFFGFWIAEGWTTATPGLYQVGVAQVKNNGYLEEIFDTLKKLGFNPTYTKDLTQVRVFDKRLWNYLVQFGKAENKFVPSEVLNLSPRQLNIFLDWFLKGDGSQDKSGKRYDKRLTKDGNIRGEVNFNTTRKRAYTVSKKLADNIQEICLKTGVISTITNRGLRNSVMTDGRKVNAKYDAYTISIGANSNRSKKTPLLRAEDQYQEYYDDYVYCVEVPNNIIYVRRNGKTMWIGNSHLGDLELLNESMNMLHNDLSLQNKYQIVVCGYDVRGFMTEIGPKGEHVNTRKIEKHETIWNKFEEIFTNKYNPKFVSAEYVKYLKKCSREAYKGGDVMQENFMRRWTLPLTRYGEHYNYCDVCLAPLAKNIFNEVKSELKIIEAGLKRKALIAQDYGIYKELIKNNETGILIPMQSNTRGWYEAIKKVVENKEFRETMADNLYNFVIDKYTLPAVTKKRVDFYLEIIKDRNLKIADKASIVTESL